MSVPYPTKLFFTSLVRPNIEYCSSVWSPLYQVHIVHIESVQKQFLIFDLRGLNWNQNVWLPSFSIWLLLNNLPTLVSRRTMLGNICMHNLIRGDFHSVDLVSRRTFNVPVRLMRNYYPINVPRSSAKELVISKSKSISSALSRCVSLLIKISWQNR